MKSLKLQNSKQNRKALVEAGYRIYDPHYTFKRKAWIIIGTDGLLYGVNRRNFPVVSAEEYWDDEKEPYSLFNNPLRLHLAVHMLQWLRFHNK